MNRQLQYSDDFLSKENIVTNIHQIWTDAQPILTHRKEMYDRYTRIFDKPKEEDPIVALEYYITTIASGYFGGKEPQYKVKIPNETQKKIAKEVFEKEYNDKNKPEAFQAIVDNISSYNDNESFFYNTVKDYMITGACYGLVYENKNNEIIYAKVPSIQSIAIWNYDTPSQKIGLLRYWTENTGKQQVTHLQITTQDYKKEFVNNVEKKENDKFKELEDKNEDVLWDDTPIFAVENEDGLGIFENVISLIKKHEQVIKNNANTFEYNDNAKLKITGYTPDNPILIEKKDEKGEVVLDKNGNPEMVENEARKEEDKAVLKSKVFYTPDANGNIEWIIKNLNDTASENHKKTCLDLALMISGVPNVTDQGFTNADNASAIEKKFFPLDQVLQQADKDFRKELLRMWEFIIARINLKRGTTFDFRDIEIILTRNLPSNASEVVTNWLRLRGLVSDKTVISHMPYDLNAESEIAEMDLQNEQNIQKNLEQMQLINSVGVEQEETENKKDDKVEDLSTTQKAQKLTADNKKEQEKVVKKQIKKENDNGRKETSNN